MRHWHGWAVACGVRAGGAGALRAAGDGDRCRVARVVRLAPHRSLPRRAHDGRDRRRHAAEPVLHRHRQRRRVEDDRRRPHVAADLRRSTRRVDRRDRGRAGGSERDLRRHGRGRPSPGPLDRERALQVDRWRPHLDARRAAGLAADRGHRDRRARSAADLRRRARTSLRTERRARRLPIDGRRPHVRARAVRERQHRRRRGDDRSDRTRGRSTRRCGNRGRRRGERARSPARAPGCSSPRTAARHGARSPPACRTTPTMACGRIAMAIAPSRPARLFAAVDADRRAGLYRSDDGGETWTIAAGSTRLVSPESAITVVTVDPRNPDVVFAGGRGIWKSTDAGATFAIWRSAQAGEEIRRLWLGPGADTAIVAGDRGAAVSVNGGATWSSTFNQPTAQFDRVVADAAFPYRVCGNGADGDVLCVASRGDAGRVTIRDWAAAGPVAGDVAPDPAEADLVYGFGGSRAARRPRRAVRSPHRTGAGHRPAARSGLPRAADGAAPLLAGREPHDLLWRQHPLEDRVRRPDVDGDQPGSLARDVDRTRLGRRLRQQRRRARGATRRDSCRRAVVRRSEHGLGRHDRRADSRHARRRQELDGRDAAGRRGVGEGVAARSVALRRERRLRRHRHRAARRSSPAPLSDAGRRPHVGRDRPRSARVGRGAHDSRGSVPPRPALRRHGRRPCSCRSTTARRGRRCG